MTFLSFFIIFCKWVDNGCDIDWSSIVVKILHSIVLRCVVDKWETLLDCLLRKKKSICFFFGFSFCLFFDFSIFIVFFIFFFIFFLSLFFYLFFSFVFSFFLFIKNCRSRCRCYIHPDPPPDPPPPHHLQPCDCFHTGKGSCWEIHQM